MSAVYVVLYVVGVQCDAVGTFGSCFETPFSVALRFLPIFL